MKRPSFQFYPGDWRRDLNLQRCSIAARGLWIEMMCLMADGKPYGHLGVDGAPLGSMELARMVGVTPRSAKSLLGELQRAGVFSVTETGVIYSRRMVRDAEFSDSRRAGGIARQRKDAEHDAEHDAGEARQQDALAVAEAEAEETEISCSRKKKNKPLEEYVLPEWVPCEEWADFVAMRSQIRKPVDASAAKYCVRKLEKLRESGSDPAEVLAQSVASKWQGLFAVEGEKNGRKTFQQEREDNIRRSIKRAIADS